MDMSPKPHAVDVARATIKRHRADEARAVVSSMKPVELFNTQHAKQVLKTTLNDSRFFIAGTVGGMVGVAAGQPFDTIKVRMQTAGLDLPSWARKKLRVDTVWGCVRRTFYADGVRGFYRGMSSPMLGVSLQKSTAFGVYGFVKTSLQGRSAEPQLHHVALAGMCGGVANSTILTPVDQLKICLQVEGQSATSGGPTTLRGAAKQIISGPANAAEATWGLSLSGIRAIYAALPATLLREIPGYSLYFTTYELLSRVRRHYDATWAIPFVGGAAGVVMWGSYYPLDMVKSRSMAEVANSATTADGVTRPSSLRTIFKQVYKEGGVRAFYKGVQPALIRAFFTHGAVFMAYEAVLHLATLDEDVL